MNDSIPDQLWTGKESPSEVDFTPATNASPAWNKPDGGLWTSTMHTEGKSAWTDFCESEFESGIEGDTRWVLSISPDARVYTIDSYEDLEDLYNQFPGPSSENFGFDTRGTLDFEAIALEYDGIHITDDGQWATRNSRPLCLYGWDFESTVWLNWVVDGYRKAQTRKITMSGAGDTRQVAETPEEVNASWPARPENPDAARNHKKASARTRSF